LPVVRRPLIAGNWKMNALQADGIALAATLAERFQARPNANFEMLLAPPFPLIAKVGEAIAGSGLSLGGQDCHHLAKGAHTGDVSAIMLADLGCHYVIVGHSERRAAHAETNADVSAKAAAAHKAGLGAIICIGETQEERDTGKHFDVAKAQIAGSLPDGAAAANTVIAYEPVWAIGSGRTPSPENVQEMHAFIRSQLATRLDGEEADGIRILYGGSLLPTNAGELLALPDIDGGLIGGASLVADDFWSVAESCP